MSSLSSQESAWAATVAEAAAWIALMHGPNRTAATERGLKRWLAEDPLHAQAFELATETWNETRAAVKREARVKLILPGENEARGRNTWHRTAMAAAAAMAVLGVAIAATLYVQRSGMSTGIGERRVLALKDGSQLYLNTSTRVVVDYDNDRRHVRLLSGEALFDVAKQAGRPFVVSVGEKEITALGTSFLVRHDDERIAVTLVEGKIAVTQRVANGPIAAARELAPGERVTYTPAGATVKVDRPEIEKITAWQNGKVNLDNLTLAEAVIEMNRYSAVKLEVQGAEASGLRLSGIFRISDSKNFANAVAKTHGLQIWYESDRVVLSGIPQTMSKEK